MEEFLAFLSSLTGLDGEGVLLLLGIVVAAANFIGKLIPDDAQGVMALIRRVAKVLGLYIENQRSSGPVDSNRIRSPGIVGLLAIGLAAIVLSGCTLASLGIARAATAAICASADVAQHELNVAAHDGRVQKARQIIYEVQKNCPSVFLALDLQEARLHGVVPVPPAPTPAPVE